MRKIFAVLYCLLIALSLGGCASAREVSNARNGVVCVAVYDSQSHLVSWGTGFAVGTPSEPVQYIVTNQHVIKSSISDGNSLKIYFSSDSMSFMSADVLQMDVDRDLALLELQVSTRELRALSFAGSAQVQTAETVFALGFPGDTFDTGVVEGFSRTDITILQGIISNRLIQKNVKTFQISVPISPGFSGGPLVNSRGQIIGVNTRRLEANESIGYAVTVDELMVFLDSAGIEYRTSATSTRFWLLLVCGMLFFALLATGSWLILRNRTRRKHQYLGRVPMGIPVSNAGPDTHPKSTVYGISGELSNSSFGLGKDALVFGTDRSRCHVQFRPETSGVSGIHCRVSGTADGTYELTDLGSESGTFLNRTRLEDNTPAQLTNGDQFYLGTEQNLFRFGSR